MVHAKIVEVQVLIRQEFLGLEICIILLAGGKQPLMHQEIDVNIVIKKTAIIIYFALIVRKVVGEQVCIIDKTRKIFKSSLKN